MINFEGLEVVDYLRSGAIIVAVIATIVADKKGEHKVWSTADVLVGGAFGAGLYLFPNVLLEYQTTVKPDFVLLHLTRSVGAALMARSIALYYTSGTKDNAVTTAWLLCRVIGGLAIFVLMINTHGQNSSKLGLKDQHVTFGMLAAGLLTLGNAYHLFQQSDLGSIRRDGIRKDALGKHLIIDLLLVGTTAIVRLTAVEGELDYLKMKDVTIGPLHIYLFRIMFIMLLTSRLFCLQAINFNNDNDKTALFKGYLWMLVFIMPWGILFWYQGQIAFTGTLCDFICQRGPFILAALNAMCANGCFAWLCNCCGNCCTLKWLKGE